MVTLHISLTEAAIIDKALTNYRQVINFNQTAVASTPAEKSEAARTLYQIDVLRSRIDRDDLMERAKDPHD